MRRTLSTLLVVCVIVVATSGCQSLHGGWSVVFPFGLTAEISAEVPSFLLLSTPPGDSPVTHSFVLSPALSTPAFHLQVTVYDETSPPRKVVATFTALAPGEALVVQSFYIPPGRAYSFVLTGADGTVGEFFYSFAHYSNLEEETVTSNPNDTIDRAESIQASFLPVGSRAERGAVWGTLAGGSDVDLYAFSLAAGDVIDVVLQEPNIPAGFSIFTAASLSQAWSAAPGLSSLSSRWNVGDVQMDALPEAFSGLASAAAGEQPFTLRLLDASGTELAPSAAYAALNVDFASGYTIPTSGTYYAEVSHTDPLAGSVKYQLLVARGADFEQEQNDRAATAQQMQVGRPVLGYLGYDWLQATSMDAQDAPGLVEMFPFVFGIGLNGAFYAVDGLGTEVGIEYSGWQAISLDDPHTVILKGPDSTEYVAASVAYRQQILDNLNILQINGSFSAPGGEIEFLRDVMWYEGQAHAFVQTQLINNTGSLLTGFQLVDRFNPAPGLVEETGNDRVLNSDLLVSTAGSLAFGAGSPDPDMDLFFEIVHDPQGAVTDDAMLLTYSLPQLENEESVTSGYYLLFGENAAGLQAAYQAAVADGFAMEDYFQVTLEEGTPYLLSAYFPSIFMTGAPASSPSLAVYDTQGALVFEIDGDLPEAASGVRFIAPADGTYTIRAYRSENMLDFGFDYVLSMDEDWIEFFMPLIHNAGN